MRQRLLGLAVGATLVVAACGTGTPSNAPTDSGGSAPPSTGPGASPSGTAAGTIDLFGTNYAPEDGVDGGTLIVGDWQEANLFNPFYISQQTEANVVSATWATLVVFTADYKYAPDLATDVPTLDNGGVKVPGDGGDAMTVTWTLRDGLKWSDGEPLTCDDFKYAWEWVLDDENVGVVTSGFEDIEDFECASDTEMVLH
ncbi:MAG TPA: ABC transporter substrate-binding protein, partial [Candidatus Limnocylindrales bacterium]|nr:ABC transporter substrate-binding protein [Candidatus Limnocylindrales bacterium]